MSSSYINVDDKPYVPPKSPIEMVEQMPESELSNKILFRKGDELFQAKAVFNNGNLEVTLARGEDGMPVKIASQQDHDREVKFLAMLAERNLTQSEKNDISKEMDKILQYNYGSLKFRDSESMYIPQSFTKQESLAFMTKIAKDVQKQGIEENDYMKVKLSKKLLTFVEKLEDKAYTAQHVQSVFNTIGERETERMGGMARFNKTLDQFISDVQLKYQMRSMIKAYYDHRSSDFDYGFRNDLRTEVKSFNEAKSLRNELGGGSISHMSPQESGIGVDTYISHGNGRKSHPYVIESDSTNKQFFEQLALDTMLASYKNRIGGYGYYHDKDSSRTSDMADNHSVQLSGKFRAQDAENMLRDAANYDPVLRDKIYRNPADINRNKPSVEPVTVVADYEKPKAHENKGRSMC